MKIYKTSKHQGITETKSKCGLKEDNTSGKEFLSSSWSD